MSSCSSSNLAEHPTNIASVERRSSCDSRNSPTSTFSTASPSLSSATTADGDSESGSSSCACSNIAIMQLFHELKAEFPTVPDHVVSQCISDHYHDRDTCRSLLSAEQTRVPRGVPYPPGLMGVITGRVDPTPLTCYCNSIDLQHPDDISERHSPLCDDDSSKCSSDNINVRDESGCVESRCKCGKLRSAKVNRGTTIYQDNNSVDVSQVIIQTKDNLQKVSSKHIYGSRGDNKSDLNLINLKKSLQKVVPFNNLKNIKRKVFSKHRHHYHQSSPDEKSINNIQQINKVSKKNNIKVPNNTTSKSTSKDNDVLVARNRTLSPVNCVDSRCVDKSDKENNNNNLISSIQKNVIDKCVSSSGSNESEKSSSCTDTTVIKVLSRENSLRTSRAIDIESSDREKDFSANLDSPHQMSDSKSHNVSTQHSKTSSHSSKTRISHTKHVGDVRMNVQTETVAFNMLDDGLKTSNFRSYRRSGSKTNPDSGFFGESSIVDNSGDIFETANTIENIFNRRTSIDNLCSTLSSTLKTKSQSMESILSEGGYYGDTDSSILRNSPVSQRTIAEIESMRSGSLHSKYGSDRVLTSSRRRQRREQQIETVSSSESTVSDTTQLRLNRPDTLHLDKTIECPKSPFMLKKSSRMKHIDRSIETVAQNCPKPPPVPIKPVRVKRHHLVNHDHSKFDSNENNSGHSSPTSLTPSTSSNLLEARSNLPQSNQKPPLPKRPNSLELKSGINASLSPQGGPSPTSFNSPGSVNVSLNVNVDVVSPLPNRRSTVINIHPKPFWASSDIQSPRSYTSVNLTLRPPCSEPQDPIDISSANSRLTYSTSSYDPRKGLQSNLQITVGPAGGTVSTVRTRPRSSYYDQTQQHSMQLTPRAGSLPNLSTPLVQRQIERKERLRIELESEKSRLLAMQKEILDLEAMTPELTAADADLEETRLLNELHFYERECKKLAEEVDRRAQLTRVPLGETDVEFYRNIYTGQRGLLRPPLQPSSQNIHEGVHWTCNMCTFSNHPLMDKCEQCDMPRIVLGRLSITSPYSQVKHSPPTSPFVLLNEFQYDNETGQSTT